MRKECHSHKWMDYLDLIGWKMCDFPYAVPCCVWYFISIWERSISLFHTHWAEITIVWKYCPWEGLKAAEVCLCRNTEGIIISHKFWLDILPRQYIRPRWLTTPLFTMVRHGFSCSAKTGLKQKGYILTAVFYHLFLDKHYFCLFLCRGYGRSLAKQSIWSLWTRTWHRKVWEKNGKILPGECFAWHENHTLTAHAMTFSPCRCPLPD